MAASRRLRVEVLAPAGRPPLSAARCRRILEAAARHAPPPPPRRGDPRPPSVTVLFAGPAAMRSLNARFRGRRRSADVLSFPARPDARSDATPEGPHLGDLAIGVAAARRQARDHGHALGREIAILLLHGYLHLVGYDHETDGGRMERLEARLRRRLLRPERRGGEGAAGRRAARAARSPA